MQRSAFPSALALIIVSPALAAAQSAPPVFIPPPIPAFSWNGFYAGAQGGYAFGKDNTNSTAVTRGRKAPVGGEGGGGGNFNNLAVRSNAVAAPAAAVASVARAGGTTFTNISSDPSGVVGGGHVGYNLAASQLFGGVLGTSAILGIEGDAEGLDDSTTTYFGSSFSKVKSDLQGSIRGRLGFGFDRFLVYGTGGAAFADFKTTYSLNNVAFPTFDATRVGYTVGGGVAYAFTSNWAVNVEYRYSDFGSFENTYARGLTSVVVRHRETTQRIEGGISYFFTTPVAPAIIARY